MLTIRFARRGRKKIPFYDIVLADKRQAVQKKYIELLGYFNPLAHDGEGELRIDEKRVEFFVNNGAEISQTAARVLVKNDIKSAGKFVKQRHTVAQKPKEEPKAKAEPEQSASEEAEVPRENSKEKEAETANDANSSEAEAVPAEKKTAGVSDNQEADPAEAKETKKNTDTTKNTDNSAEKTDANPEADATPATEDSEKK